MTDANTICHDVDLLGDWLDAKGYIEEAGLCLCVLNLIHKQEDEIKRLREALQPFSDIADHFTDEAPKTYLVKEYLRTFRAARTALQEGKNEGK